MDLPYHNPKSALRDNDPELRKFAKGRKCFENFITSEFMKYPPILLRPSSSHGNAGRCVDEFDVEGFMRGAETGCVAEAFQQARLDRGIITTEKV